MISYIIIAAIFVYAVYTLVKFAKKSKQGGACAHCSLQSSCASSCGVPSPLATDKVHVTEGK